MAVRVHIQAHVGVGCSDGAEPIGPIGKTSRLPTNEHQSCRNETAMVLSTPHRFRGSNQRRGNCFLLLAKHRGTWPMAWLCAPLGVSRSGFHAWLGRSPARDRAATMFSP